MEPKINYCIYQCMPPVPIQSQIKPLYATSWRPILILSSHLFLGLSSGLFPQVSPPKPCIHLSFPQYMLHIPPISFVSIFIARTLFDEEYR